MKGLKIEREQLTAQQQENPGQYTLVILPVVLAQYTLMAEFVAVVELSTLGVSNLLMYVVVLSILW